MQKEVKKFDFFADFDYNGNWVFLVVKQNFSVIPISRRCVANVYFVIVKEKVSEISNTFVCLFCLLLFLFILQSSKCCKDSERSV